MELEQKLAELKSALEADFNTKYSKEVTDLKAKLAEVETKAATANKEQIDALKKEIEGYQATIKSFSDDLEKIDTRVKDNSQKAAQRQMTFADSVQKALDENHDNIEKFARKETKKLEMEIKAVADVSTANVTGSTVYGAQMRNGIIMNPNQIGHMREFFRPISAGPGTDYYFMKENGAGEGAPAFVAEKKAASATNVGTGLKPAFDVDVVESSVKFEILAGYMVASRKSLNNIPAFSQFLNQRLPEKLLDVEDTGILYGTGTTPEIKGLLVSGNFTASTTSATRLSEALIDDVALLEDTNKRIASGIWLRPVDYWNIWKETASGSGEYNLSMAFNIVGGQLYLGNVPIYKTTALVTDDYMVAASGGADLLVQEGIRIEFFEQDGNNARTNQVTVRIEETIALPVYGSTYFIKGTSDLGS